MHIGRYCFGAATLKGEIYAVGGYDGGSSNTPINTVEVFCPKKKTWKMIKPMNVARAKVKAVAMDGCLYVVGGWDGSRELNSGEMYNPDLDTWSNLPNMKVPRCSHSLVVV